MAIGGQGISMSAIKRTYVPDTGILGRHPHLSALATDIPRKNSTNVEMGEELNLTPSSE